MRALCDLPRAQAARVSVLFTDIDDTLSTEGRITEPAFAALWRAAEAGLKVVPVTGRPAGWCDHIARMWPVHGVIGENGGLVFRMADGRMERHFLYDDATRAGFRERLAVIRQVILREVPGCAVASDQAYREYDLAIDFCEDVPRLPREQVLVIQRIFEEHGATAKISSIHVNGWFGSFDKLSAARSYLRDHLALDPDSIAAQAACAFAGDSPNDEPMFSFFRLNSTGVANLLDFADLLEHRPAWITPSRGGAGFAELVDHLLASRA
jgi:HAD superfamily hydrolase (TIGR01484 family)